jgi:hypothetical protein
MCRIVSGAEGDRSLRRPQLSQADTMIVNETEAAIITAHVLLPCPDYERIGLE